MPTSPPSPRPALVVVCLCAQWCGTCGSYRSVFAQLQAQFPACRFVWIDVEDEADLVGPIEVDDFPTVLIANHGQARFFGPLLPHAQTLRRLIQAQLDDDSPALLPSPQVQALAARVQDKLR